MKKQIVYLSLYSITIFSCTTKSPQNNEYHTKHEEVHSFTLAEKAYFGVLPCASCPGIETRIFFKKDGTCTHEILFQENDVFPTITQGKYKLKNNLITLTFSQPSETEQYLLKPDNKLYKLDREEKEITGELAAYYILTEIAELQPELMMGRFIKGKGKSADVLVINHIKKNKFSVQITTGIKKECFFSGIGIQKKDRLFINLSEVQKDINTVMTITITPKNAFVFVDREPNKYDLMYFCGGGGSLIGEYVRQ